MRIIAKTHKGKEYLYIPRTARKVSARSADKILKVVNNYKFLLDESKDEIWHVYDVDEYDAAYYYAERQAFTIRNGIVTARAY